MKFKARLSRLLLSQLLISSAILSASAAVTAQVKESRLIYDFNSSSIPSALSAKNTDLSIANVSAEDNSVLVNFRSKENYEANFDITPETPWNWDDLNDFALALDIKNSESTSLFIYVRVSDDDGQTHNRSVVIPAKSDNTYYIELKGADLNTETGLRANPKNWVTDYTPIVWRWGVKNLNLSAIKSVSFSINTQVSDRSISIDNLRLIEPIKTDSNYLVKLVDKYGQNTRVDYAQKIHSDEQLVKLTKQELKSLRSSPLPGRSRFGGWKDGPKLKSTGFFRAEKVDEKWSLVDPDGYLFFSHGLANVRMANTTTMTGYDFDHSKIKERSADDLTPEDSIAVTRVSDDAIKTRKVTSELRANMFAELPDYSSKMGKHYGYRRVTHIGAVERGENYSFYQANLERRYDIEDKPKLFEKWRDVTVDRMLSWGFTSFGNWIDPMFYQLNRYPYFANGWIIGDFKTVSSGNDYWSPLPDPFDPKFTERTIKTVEQIDREVKDNPWCIGVFIDNEKSWGQMGSTESQYGIVLNTLTRPNSDSPTKAVFADILKNKYNTIAKLNKAWNTKLDSWDELDAGVTLTNFTEAAIEDFSVMLETYASEYFRIVAKTVKEYMPNHMYMGARLASWGMTPEIRTAAAKHSDVMSYNVYKESIHPESWTFLKEIDMPSIIGEFHMGAADTGLFNPGLIMGENQVDRARLYTTYMDTVVNNPYFVGAHWFQYLDSPVSGRAFDGENYNVGFVSVADVPYTEMIEAAKTFNQSIYSQRYGASE